MTRVERAKLKVRLTQVDNELKRAAAVIRTTQNFLKQLKRKLANENQIRR